MKKLYAQIIGSNGIERSPKVAEVKLEKELYPKDPYLDYGEGIVVHASTLTNSGKSVILVKNKQSPHGIKETLPEVRDPSTLFSLLETNHV